MNNPYEDIGFDRDGVAWLLDREVTVEQVMSALSNPENTRRKVCIALRITDHHIDAAEAFARDAWCTPQYVADVLPDYHCLCDPCSNPRSLVLARFRYMLENGENGLELPWVPSSWTGLPPAMMVYVNAGFSDLWPWAEKLRVEREGIAGAAFMVNVDNSTRWWQSLTEQCACVFLFDKRIPFIPHPGVPKSGNNKPQALIGDRAFFDKCKPGLFELGEMYEKTRARSRRAA